MEGSPFKRMSVEDALSYLDQVKYKFRNKPQLYNNFLEIMKEFKLRSIDTPGIIQYVTNLFRDQPELISGFNAFLPVGYKIELVQPSNHIPQTAINQSHSNSQCQYKYRLRVPDPDFGIAINYVKKVKDRFQGQPDMYGQFLEVLHRYQREQRNLQSGIPCATEPLTEAELYTQLAKLFQNHNDLLQEIGYFLPQFAVGAANSLVGLQEKLRKDLGECEVEAEVKRELLGIFEKDLLCNICTELFIKPTVLGCSHTFCQFCIQEWKKKKNQCPICRNKIQTMIPVLALENFINETFLTLTPAQRFRRSHLIRERENALKKVVPHL